MQEIGPSCARDGCSVWFSTSAPPFTHRPIARPAGSLADDRREILYVRTPGLEGPGLATEESHPELRSIASDPPISSG